MSSDHRDEGAPPGHRAARGGPGDDPGALDRDHAECAGTVEQGSEADQRASEKPSGQPTGGLTTHAR